MYQRFTNFLLISSVMCGYAWTQENLAPKCPAPDKRIQASCKEITYKDLPSDARTLLRRMKCNVHSAGPYDYGSAVDLNGDGIPEYEVCCTVSRHGPCRAVVIGKVGNQWKDLTAKEGVDGFEGACNLFVVLQSQHFGFHDICLPIECTPGSPNSQNCAPLILHYENGRYRVSASP